MAGIGNEKRYAQKPAGEGFFCQYKSHLEVWCMHSPFVLKGLSFFRLHKHFKRAKLIERSFRFGLAGLANSG
jgi:hypothetical protein